MRRISLRVDTLVGLFLLLVLALAYHQLDSIQISNGSSSSSVCTSLSPSLQEGDPNGPTATTVDESSSAQKDNTAGANEVNSDAETTSILHDVSDGDLLRAAFHPVQHTKCSSNLNDGSNSNEESTCIAAQQAVNNEFYENFEHKVEALLSLLGNETDALTSHDHYILTRAFLLRRLAQSRQSAVLNTTRTQCLEFVRLEQKPEDTIYRVPCVPWTTINVDCIHQHSFGLWVKFYHIPIMQPPDESSSAAAAVAVEEPKTPSSSSAALGEAMITVKDAPKPNLRVAVEMSGHMRTFRRCWKSTVDNVLKPNGALLFISTYPDIGDKRFGVRFQDRDDPAPVDEIASYYSPYLGGVFVADVPSIRRRLVRWFSTVFQLTQWSWMIYQLFMMEIAHNITLTHDAPDEWITPDMLTPGQCLFSSQSAGGVFSPPAADSGLVRGGVQWADIDVIIRIRPDLFILGPVTIRAASEIESVFTLYCGGRKFIERFSKNVSHVLRAPHHPRLEWFADPLSDHSAVGYRDQMHTFLRLFHDAFVLDAKKQERIIFFHGNTAERMWLQHGDRHKMHVLAAVGWHIMLRNPQKWTNSTAVVAHTKRRKILTQKIFGVTDPKIVGCPDPDKQMFRLPKKRRISKRVAQRAAARNAKPRASDPPSVQP